MRQAHSFLLRAAILIVFYVNGVRLPSTNCSDERYVHRDDLVTDFDSIFTRTAWISSVYDLAVEACTEKPILEACISNWSQYHRLGTLEQYERQRNLELNNRTRISIVNCRLKFRRHKCPCLYYSNSVASIHLPLTGDLVFKLNPGPVQNRTPTIATSIRNHRSSYHSNQRSNVDNLRNLTNLNSPLSSSSSTVNHFQDPSLFGLLNARSVKNKTAVLVDYLYDRKIHLLAITETWMTDNDASVRADLCPDGYNFLHHPRVGCRGGGTGLIFRDFLHVVSVNVGQKES